ncbi:MAG: cobalamin biosynthesis protein [Cypionkella sp.]
MIVVGMGFRRSADLADLREVFLAAGGARASVLATAEDKADAAVLIQFAAEHGLPIRAVALKDLAAQPTPSNSSRVQALYHTGCLAEAAALVVAGPNARLVSARVQSLAGKATAALAEGSPL